MIAVREIILKDGCLENEERCKVATGGGREVMVKSGLMRMKPLTANEQDVMRGSEREACGFLERGRGPRWP